MREDMREIDDVSDQREWEETTAGFPQPDGECVINIFTSLRVNGEDEVSVSQVPPPPHLLLLHHPLITTTPRQFWCKTRE